MSQRTQTFSASGTFTASSVLLGGTVTVDVRGAAGGGGLLRGGVGGAGGRVQGVVTLAASGTLAVTVGVHQNGYSGGGGVGGGNSGYGGGGSAVVKSGTLLVEAGGGGGAGTTTTGGAGGGGGHAGGAGSVDSAHGGGGGGAQGGNGGSGYSGNAGGTGVGGGTNGSGGSATSGGAGAGSGGSTGGGSGTRGGAAGGSSFAAAVVSGPVFTGAFNTSNTGAVLITYSVADPDLQPTLMAPANGSYVDMSTAGSITFKRNPGTQSGTLTGWALRRKSSGSYSYWKASTGTWTSSIVYNSATLLTALGTGVYRYNFASAKWTDGTTYQWNVSTQGTLTGHAQNGPFASTDFTVNATTMPTVTITSPSTTATTGTPTVSWTHTLGATKSQTKYRVVIYTKVQASSGGFSPGVTAGVWDSGLTSGATTSVVVGTTLVNGTTYVAFLQITETGPIASAWTPKSFKVSFTPPATPSFTATSTTGANTHPQVSLVVSGSGTNLTTATIERSINGTTWTPVRGGTGAPLLHDTCSLIDQECPLGGTVYYRARVTGVSTGQVVVSAWATQTVTLPNAQFWIGDPTTPTSFIPLWRAPTQSSSMSGGGAASMTLQQTQVQGSFRCFGRSTYVTVFGTLMDEEFTLTLNFFTTALYQEFLALRAQNITVLVQSDMPGEQYYVTFGGTRPMSIMRASTRKVTPIRQLAMHFFPATVP